MPPSAPIDFPFFPTPGTEDDALSTAFYRGIQYFNQSLWFEAHEIWEEAWNLAVGADKRFYQGLIQCAVCLEHIRQGNPRGALRVCESARMKLDGLPNPYLRLDHQQLTAALTKMVAILEQQMPVESFAPANKRGWKIPAGLLDQAPRINLLPQG